MRLILPGGKKLSVSASKLFEAVVFDLIEQKKIHPRKRYLTSKEKQIMIYRFNLKPGMRELGYVTGRDYYATAGHFKITTQRVWEYERSALFKIFKNSGLV
jgi:hypothetical protein